MTQEFTFNKIALWPSVFRVLVLPALPLTVPPLGIALGWWSTANQTVLLGFLFLSVLAFCLVGWWLSDVLVRRPERVILSTEGLEIPAKNLRLSWADLRWWRADYNSILGEVLVLGVKSRRLPVRWMVPHASVKTEAERTSFQTFRQALFFHMDRREPPVPSYHRTTAGKIFLLITLFFALAATYAAIKVLT